MKLNLQFSNNFNFNYKIHSTQMARTWAQLFTFYNDTNAYTKHEVVLDGFTQQPHLQDVDFKLKGIITSLRSRGFDLPAYSSQYFTTEELNDYHSCYEKYDQTFGVYELLRDLNDTIHQYEAYIVGDLYQNQPNQFKRIRCRFIETYNGLPNVFKIKFTKQDFSKFVIVTEPGGLYLNYSQTGKHAFDCFKNGESVQNMVPWEVYGPAFVSDFTRTSKSDRDYCGKFTQWLIDNDVLGQLGTAGWPEIGMIEGDYKEIADKIGDATCIDMKILE